MSVHEVKLNHSQSDSAIVGHPRNPGEPFFNSCTVEEKRKTKLHFHYFLNIDIAPVIQYF